MQSPVSAERVHIGFFGRRNAGKSSLVNAITGQDLAVVSDVPGTTTDPVQKAMELSPLGPVVIIDTPGIDDEGELGALRVQKTKETLRRTDIAVLVIDASVGMTEADEELLAIVEKERIRHLTVFNKSDLSDGTFSTNAETVYTSVKNQQSITILKEKLAQLLLDTPPSRSLLDGVLSSGETALLVIPVDESAPKGRLILPQQQTIQEILLMGAKAMIARDTELPAALSALAENPKIVITDSQAFGRVSKMLPESIPLTSFSILFARYKGDLDTLVRGAAALDRLRDGDTILISEGCTHHRQCGDIGSVKLPAWIRQYTQKDLRFAFTSGREFPEDLSSYALVVHCGGCMLNEREMHSRMKMADAAGVPMTNYGVTIAQIHGILRRSLAPFPSTLALLD